MIRKIDALKGQKMDLELDLGPFKICGKDRTEGPFLADDRWPDLGPKKLDTLRYHACIPVPKTLIIWVLVPILTSSTIDKKLEIELEINKNLEYELEIDENL